MDQIDFAIAMVSGVLIIIAIFLFILFKIFGKKKNAKLIETSLPDIDKIEPREFQPEKFGIRTQKIEGLEKEFQLAHEHQKKRSVVEIMGEQKEEKSSIEPEKTIVPLNETAKILKDIKEEPLINKKKESLKESTEPINEILLSKPVILSNEENEKLKLEDILIGTRDENNKKKVKKKRTPEKKPKKRTARKKIQKDSFSEQVSKESKEKTQANVNENPESGEM